MKKIVHSISILFCFVAVVYAAPGLSIPDNEILIYRVIPEQGETYTSKTIYKSETKEGSVYYSYLHTDKDMTFDVRTHSNGLPEKIIWKSGNTNASFSFDGSGLVKLVLNGKEGSAEKTGRFMPNVSVENTLIARTLDLTSTEKYEFDLIQCDKLPELIAFRMYFQVMGEETVTVGAGTFKCKKVLFSLIGWKGVFYKAYYYISNDEHRYPVKMKNMPEGGSCELIEIQ